MNSRRSFLKICCSACAGLLLPNDAGQASVDGDESIPFICKTIEPVPSNSELQVVASHTQSNDLDLRAAPITSDTFTLTPYGTAFLKDTWLQHDVPNRNGKLLIGVTFVGGDQHQHQQIRTSASTWLSTAVGTKFDFDFDVPKSASVLRVDFDPKDGNWSYVGRENLHQGRNDKTMNIASLTTSAVQHEFGHALGLRHEHQFPGKALRWHKDRVVADMEKLGWNAQMTEEQILKKYDARATCIGDPDFNPKSIMLYPIAPGWAEIQDSNGAWTPFVTAGNNSISQGDVSCLRGLYRI